MKIDKDRVTRERMTLAVTLMESRADDGAVRRSERIFTEVAVLHAGRMSIAFDRGACEHVSSDRYALNALEMPCE